MAYFLGSVHSRQPGLREQVKSGAVSSASTSAPVIPQADNNARGEICKEEKEREKQEKKDKDAKEKKHQTRQDDVDEKEMASAKKESDANTDKGMAEKDKKDRKDKKKQKDKSRQEEDEKKERQPTIERSEKKEIADLEIAKAMNSLGRAFPGMEDAVP